MKTLYQSLLLALSALALAGTAYAQVPSTNDTSDSNANTGMGTNALSFENSGRGNTASGFDALLSNTSGGDNTASGAFALQANSTGAQNTAAGFEALFANQTGNDNTASGFQALFSNGTGGHNTASGFEALQQNTTGDDNTASGAGALISNTSGGDNTASGVDALSANMTGNDNTASGFEALLSNTIGGFNTASGVDALVSNTAGNDNTASGVSALSANTSGSNNIAVGFQAGLNLTTGSNNIDIGNLGVAGESNLIRIGTKGTHKGAVIAGISSSQVTGSAVYVTSSGRLGVLASSERFKTAIAPIGPTTERLHQLRPVSFHLKADPKGAVQYGLIAEEVAKVYPELVIRNEAGRIDGLRYDELVPMLLNEMQREREQMTDEMHDLKQQVAELKALNQATQGALQKLQAKEEFVAQR